MTESEMTVNTVQDAMDVSRKFLRAYFSKAVPVSAARENSRWVVKMDVGNFFRQVATLHIDSTNGTVLSYDLGDSELPGFLRPRRTMQ